MFDDETGTLSCPFEVIATKTALSNAAALARHKLAITPKPSRGELSSDSSPEVDSSIDEWTPGSEETVVDIEEDSGGETEGYGGPGPSPKSRFEIQARSAPRLARKKRPRRT